MGASCMKRFLRYINASFGSLLYAAVRGEVGSWRPCMSVVNLKWFLNAHREPIDARNSRSFGYQLRVVQKAFA